MLSTETSLFKPFLGIEVVASKYADVPTRTLDQIYRLRKEIFIDRKKWKVGSYKGGLIEFDEYDDSHAYYIYTLNESCITGCVRLRPSISPTLMTGPLKWLKDPVATGLVDNAQTWEASRFFIAPSREGSIRTRGVDKRTFALFINMVQFGLGMGVVNYEVVIDVTMKRILRMCGWPLDVLSTGLGSSGEVIYYGLLPCNISILNNISVIAKERLVVHVGGCLT